MLQHKSKERLIEEKGSDGDDEETRQGLAMRQIVRGESPTPMATITDTEGTQESEHIGVQGRHGEILHERHHAQIVGRGSRTTDEKKGQELTLHSGGSSGLWSVACPIK